MRVGLDHHPARIHGPGVGRYSRELVRALVRLPDGPEVLLSDIGRTSRTITEPALGLADAPRTAKVVSSGQGRRAFSLLRRTADGILGGVDVYHRMLPDWPPVGRAREVLSVAELHPEGSEQDAALREALGRADAIVFSTSTKDALMSRHGLPEERVHLVPVGCDHWVRDLSDPPPAKKDPPQVLVLGAIHPRRRPERVLAGLEVLKRRRRECHLLYVGRRTEHSDEFLRTRLGGSIARDWVLWNPNADETNMARILASSSALVHMTEGEETAVTPLEGLASGLPVIASRVPAFEENLAGAARLMSPEEEEDPEVVADAILAAIEGEGDPAERARVAQAHTWAASARATVEVYRKVTS